MVRPDTDPDDVGREIYYLQLLAEEGTRAGMVGLREEIEKGAFFVDCTVTGAGIFSPIRRQASPWRMPGFRGVKVHAFFERKLFLP